MNREQRAKKVVTATICALSIFCMGFALGQYEQREVFINGKINTIDNNSCETTSNNQVENIKGATNE